jgi:microcystin-dependent protein
MKTTRTFLGAILAGLLAISSPALADIYLWSQTPATNSNIDLSDDINLVEGMAPSEVNDSIRAVLAEIAKWRDDLGGIKPSAVVMTTGGSANVQTLSTNGTASTLTHGWKVCFVVGAGLTNTGATTLNVDGSGAKAVQGLDGTALAAGELAAGAMNCAVYQSADEVWLLQGYSPIDATTITYTSVGKLQRAALTGDISASAGSNTTAIGSSKVTSAMIVDGTIVAGDIATSGVATAEILDGTILTGDIADAQITAAKLASGVAAAPIVGMVFDFAGSSCPANSVAAYGQELNDTTYSALLAVTGTTYGAGGASTFNAPDLRGRVVVGEDDMGSVSANRVTTAFNGDTLGASGGEELHTMSEAEMRAHTHTGPSHTHGAGSFAVATDITNGTSVARSPSFNDRQDNGESTVTSLSTATLSLANGTVTGTSAAGGTGATGSTGSTTPFNQMQPSIVLMKCIYTGV